MMAYTFMGFCVFSVLCGIAADSDLGNSDGAYVNRYSRDLNDPAIRRNLVNNDREKRQVTKSSEYYVTQCNYNSMEKPPGASIQVLGAELDYPTATSKAAKLLHLLVRFMPRPLYLKIAERNNVGLFSTRHLPASMFEEFDDMPQECEGRCTMTFVNGKEYDCSVWCTSSYHPYQPYYPLNYLWSYGNFSRLYLAETNMVCQGFNPGNNENLLIREFGFMMMTRIMDEDLQAQLEEAYTSAVVNNTWPQITSKYDYFMKATLVWFNGISYNSAGGMSCLVQYSASGFPLCTDNFGQRQYLKEKDNKLYKILNYVYNNNREYVNADTGVCEW